MALLPLQFLLLLDKRIAHLVLCSCKAWAEAHIHGFITSHKPRNRVSAETCSSNMQKHNTAFLGNETCHINHIQGPPARIVRVSCPRVCRRLRTVGTPPLLQCARKCTPA